MRTFETTVQIDDKNVLHVILPSVPALAQGLTAVRTEQFYNMKAKSMVRIQYDKQDKVVGIELHGFDLQVGEVAR